MLKKAVQQGRSERRGESYFVSYVEPLSEARTKLADFFSIMLDQPLASSHFLHFKVSPRCCLRPSSVKTQSRFVIGGWCRTC